MKNELTDLFVDLYQCSGHPQQVLATLDIKYQHCTPQSINDSWQFWNCLDVPEELPVGIKKVSYNPLEWVGYGLSKKMADDILIFRREYKINNR